MKEDIALVARTPAIRRLRAMQMLTRRVSGATMEQIASEFNCHPDTVARNLEWAAREGLIQDAEEAIVGKLVPEAIRVYTQALAANDTFVAKDVMGHMLKIADRLAARKEHEEELSLSAWLKTRKDKLDDKARTPSAGPGGPEPAVLDAVVVPAGTPDPEPPADR